MNLNYDIDEFGKNGTLNPGGLLILVTLYLSRFLMIGPISLFASRGRGGSANLDMTFLRVDSPFEMLTSAPAVLLLFIMWTRNKDSHAITRWIWTNGRMLLLLAVSSQLLLQIANYFNYQRLDTVVIVFAMLNISVAVYLVTRQRPKDVFSMFPEKGENN